MAQIALACSGVISCVPRKKVFAYSLVTSPHLRTDRSAEGAGRRHGQGECGSLLPWHQGCMEHEPQHRSPVVRLAQLCTLPAPGQCGRGRRPPRLVQPYLRPHGRFLHHPARVHLPAINRLAVVGCSGSRSDGRSGSKSCNAPAASAASAHKASPAAARGPGTEAGGVGHGVRCRCCHGCLYSFQYFFFWNFLFFF